MFMRVYNRQSYIYTMSQNIMHMSFLSITFLGFDLECSNLDMMLVMNLPAFVLI